MALALALKGYGEDDVRAVVIGYEDRVPVEAVSGQGLVPVLTDGDEVIADSVAILRHLDTTRPEPALWPEDAAARGELDIFIEWFERVWKVAPNGIEAELEKGRKGRDAEHLERLAAEMEVHLDRFEQMLGSGRAFLLGEQVGAADLVAFPFLRYAAGRDADDDELFHRILDANQTTDGRPNLAEWIERMDRMPRLYGSSPAGG